MGRHIYSPLITLQIDVIKAHLIWSITFPKFLNDYPNIRGFSELNRWLQNKVTITSIPASCIQLSTPQVCQFHMQCSTYRMSFDRPYNYCIMHHDHRGNCAYISRTLPSQWLHAVQSTTIL